MRVLMVGIALLVLLMDGTNASRYCSYHPEAPECRGKQARPVLSDWEVETETDPAVAHEMRQNVEAEISATVSSSNAAGAAVINSTSIAIESLLPQQDDVHVEDAHVVVPAADVSPASPTAPPSSMEVHEASATQSQAAGWLLLFNTHQGRVVLEALGAVGAALVMFGVLAKLWAHRLAQQIDALDDVALGEALRRKCDAASPFAVVVDAVSGSSSVADLRRRLEAKLARLCEQRQTALEAKATRLAERVDVADRKHQFAQQWRNVHAKTLPISELEALLAQAEEVKSEFEKVIREWLEFRHQIERESTTLRLTMGDSGDGYAALTRSTELRLLAADARANLRGRYSDDNDNDSDNENDDLVTNISCEQHNHKEKKKKKKKEKKEKMEDEEEDDDEHNTRPLVRSEHEGGERSAAKRRSTSGPLGARVLEDYGRDYDSPIARELSRQNDTESRFRAMELFCKLDKQRKKQEHKIQKQQKREEENEEERSQALHRLKERQRANQIKQEKLDNQKREARKAAEEVESLAARSGLKTKLIVHASIYGGIALYHLWHGLLDSWRSALDFSSACTPAIPRLINEVCLPDLTAYLPLHILLPVLLCFLVLGVQWGGLLLQLPSLAGLCLLFVAIWSKVPSPLDFVGLVGVVVVQLLVFAGQRAIAGSPRYDDVVDGGGQPRRPGVLGAVLALVEVLLFVVNIGLALACFARRRNDALHDSFTDCFATPSDFGSCYTYY